MLLSQQPSRFSQQNISDALRLWQRASISLVDVRHRLILPAEPLKNYRLPSPAFVCTLGGKATVRLGENSFSTPRFGLFHGAKGTPLNIFAQCEGLEYYLVLYQQGPPAANPQAYFRLLGTVNPFGWQFGFAPENAIFVTELLRQMNADWQNAAPLKLFRAKASLYQLAVAAFESLEGGAASLLEVDAVLAAERFLKAHYREQISIQALCDMLGVSYSFFYKSFKARFGQSPQEYLIDARLAAAKSCLWQSDAPMREIVEFCGFADERGFYRLFAKHFGLSPNEYRKNKPVLHTDAAIGKRLPFEYNVKSQVSFDKHEEKGAALMFKQMRYKAVAAAAMSVVLALSACSAAPSNGGEVGASQSLSASQSPEGQNQETRTIKTEMGDVAVPANPQRVIVDYLIGDVVALGVVPLGVAKAEEGDSRTAFADMIGDSVIIKSWSLEPEEIMALEPDLIILSFSDKIYDDMTKIAPTVFAPYGAMTTEERIRFLGDALNRSDEAEVVLKNYQAKIADAKQRLADAGLADATVTIGQFGEKESYIAGAKHAAGVVVYNELGIKPPQKVQTDIIDADQYWGAFSMETVGEYCGDYIIGLGEFPEAFAQNQVWQLIDGVENNRVFSMPTGITWYTDIVSSSAMIDLVVDNLLAMAAAEKN